MALNKYIKWTLYSLPLVIGGGAIWYIWKHYKIPKPTKNAATNGVNPKTNPNGNNGGSAAATAGCTFPLIQGSNNPCVGQLQDVLGVTIDNDFGPKTLAALQQQVNLSQVADANALSSIEDQILAQDQSAGNVAYMSSLANNILSNYTNNTWLTVQNDTVWNEVQQNNDGSFSAVGNQITFTAGTKINLKDYEPYAVDPNSNNIIIESTGTNSNFFDTILNNNTVQALWSANPADIILQA